jgi:hypothetical protein
MSTAMLLRDLGREGSRYGLEDRTELKGVTLDL